MSACLGILILDVYVCMHVYLMSGTTCKLL